MAKTFLFCMSLKTGAFLMMTSNFVFAIMAILGASVELYYHQTAEDELYLIVTIIMGILNLFTGGILVYALIKGDEKYVLIYIVLEMANLFIVTIFSGINIFGKSWVLITLFLICIVLWYGLYAMWDFYNELAEYNTVKSGPAEITYMHDINPVMFPDRAVESTTV